VSDYNSVVLVGSLKADPKLVYATSGMPICKFEISSRTRTEGEDGTVVKKTTTVSVEVRKRMAELCAQYLAKGREVLVCGKLRLKKDGAPMIVASHIQFLGTTEVSLST
jgi:single-strand DNA-binding protein